MSHNNLHSGQTKGCGHCTNERYENLTHQRFGFLEPLYKIAKSNQNYAVWRCKCHNCGNEVDVESRTLKRGQTSCGCIKSKGELLLTQLLQQLKYKYQTQWYDKNNPLKDKEILKFDLAIFNDDNKIKCLIEYQGSQHYQSNTGWNNKEHLQLTQNHDELKRQWCHTMVLN